MKYCGEEEFSNAVAAFFHALTQEDFKHALGKFLNIRIRLGNYLSDSIYYLFLRGEFVYPLVDFFSAVVINGSSMIFSNALEDVTLCAPLEDYWARLSYGAKLPPSPEFKASINDLISYDLKLSKLVDCDPTRALEFYHRMTINLVKLLFVVVDEWQNPTSVWMENQAQLFFDVHNRPVTTNVIRQCVTELFSIRAPLMIDRLNRNHAELKNKHNDQERGALIRHIIGAYWLVDYTEDNHDLIYNPAAPRAAALRRPQDPDNIATLHPPRFVDVLLEAFDVGHVAVDLDADLLLPGEGGDR